MFGAQNSQIAPPLKTIRPRISPRPDPIRRAVYVRPRRHRGFILCARFATVKRLPVAPQDHQRGPPARWRCWCEASVPGMCEGSDCALWKAPGSDYQANQLRSTSIARIIVRRSCPVACRPFLSSQSSPIASCRRSFRSWPTGSLRPGAGQDRGHCADSSSPLSLTRSGYR